jgi:hypothetical protein
LTVPQIAGKSAGIGNRTRLPKVMDIAFRQCDVRLTPKALADLLIGLNIPIVRKQGAPAWAFRALGDPDGPYPGQFNGTEALTDDGLTALLNYLSATSPEAA